jgi:ABC-type molybdate transport system substrate-binding protein
MRAALCACALWMMPTMAHAEIARIYGCGLVTSVMAARAADFEAAARGATVETRCGASSPLRERIEKGEATYNDAATTLQRMSTGT